MEACTAACLVNTERSSNIHATGCLAVLIFVEHVVVKSLYAEMFFVRVVCTPRLSLDGIMPRVCAVWWQVGASCECRDSAQR